MEQITWFSFVHCVIRLESDISLSVICLSFRRKTQGKEIVGGLMFRWSDNIKIDIKAWDETLRGLDSIGCEQGPVTNCCQHDSVLDILYASSNLLHF